MKTLKFKNNDEMPAIGLGTWKSQGREIQDAVSYALKNGYRHIDCATNYANEAEIGEIFNQLFTNRVLLREEVWITSKLWNDSHRKKDVIPALKKTLKDLQLDYLDLYLIHWPVAFKKGVVFPENDEDYLSLEDVPLLETWEGMIAAKEEGLVRHIGVSNFSIKKLKDLLAVTNVPPEMNQVELHPMLPQHDLLKFCREHGIHLTAFSPLGSGDRIPEMKAENEPSLLQDPVITGIANNHKVTPAQVIISWNLHRGTGVIPKSTSPDHLVENLESEHIFLDEKELNQLAELNRNFRYVTGNFFVTPGNPYDNIYDD